jgi:hypothetical protein
MAAYNEMLWIAGCDRTEECRKAEVTLNRLTHRRLFRERKELDHLGTGTSDMGTGTSTGLYFLKAFSPLPINITTDSHEPQKKRNKICSTLKSIY